MKKNFCNLFDKSFWKIFLPIFGLFLVSFSLFFQKLFLAKWSQKVMTQKVQAFLSPSLGSHSTAQPRIMYRGLSLRPALNWIESSKSCVLPLGSQKFNKEWAAKQGWFWLWRSKISFCLQKTLIEGFEMTKLHRGRFDGAAPPSVAFWHFYWPSWWPKTCFQVPTGAAA